MSLILLLAGLLILVTVFLLAFAANPQYQKKTRLILAIIGFLLLITTIILVWLIMTDPLITIRI